MQEVNDENGLHAEIQKRCVFVVREHKRLPSPKAVEAWIEDHTDDPHCRLRNLTVTRKENSKTGTKHFLFKAIGSFYVVMGEEVFLVRFIQTYEVSLGESFINHAEGGPPWT